MPTIAPGLRGHVIPGDPIEIHMLKADVPWSGACRAYLDGLPKERSVIVYAVISDVLAEMLSRRGFTQVGSDWIRGGVRANRTS